MSDTYTCAHCQETFVKEISDEEAWAEFKKDFPYGPETDLVIICDDCYKLIMNENKQN